MVEALENFVVGNGLKGLVWVEMVERGLAVVGQRLQERGMRNQMGFGDPHLKSIHMISYVILHRMR